MFKKKLQLICLLLITLNIGFAFANSESLSKTTAPQKNITTNAVNIEDKNTVKNWRSLTVQALQEMHNHLKENCAGGYDLENKPWQQWLYEGYKQAQSMQEQVENQAGYDAVLEFYAAGFKDVHIKVCSDLPTKAFWPGFTAYYNANDFYINSKKKINNNAPANAKIISIDGQPVKEWFTDNVFKFAGNADLQASWHNYAHRLFLDYENPFVKKPVQCELESEGKILSINLNWQPIAKDNFLSLIKVNHPEYKFSISPFSEDGTWVSIPTLAPTKKNELAFIKKMTENGSPLNKYETVVFDVRGNTGGSSTFAYRLLTQVYNKNKLDIAIKNSGKDSFSIVRASPFNVKTYERLLDWMKTFLDANDSMLADTTQNRINPLKKAVEAGEIWYKSPFKEKLAIDSENNIKSLNNSRIYLLVDSKCISACMDFADMVSFLPNAKIVGQETNADTLYNEAVPTALTGGAQFLFPMKKHINFIRDVNQPYIPDYIYPGDIRNTKAVKQWMHELIKENKAQ